MQPYEFLQKCELRKPIQVESLRGVVFTADKKANKFTVEVVDNGQAVSLSGASVTGYAIRNDGETVVMTGSVSQNRASVTLPQSCYIVPGALDIVIKITSDGVTMAVGAWRAYVQRSTTDTIVDPGHVIPSIEELLEKIDEMEAGTAAANAAATAATTAAGNANTKAGLADTAATNANAKAADANAAAVKINDMTVGGHSVLPGAGGSATLSLVNGHYNIEFGIEQGATGAAGRDGAIADLGANEYAFNINSSGHLILTYNGESAPNFYINSNGHLIHTW